MNESEVIQRYENTIIIGKEESRRVFDGLRKDIPSLPFSFYSVDEVIALFAYRYDEAAVSYLRSDYEFDPFVAEEALTIVSLMDKSNYHTQRLKSLIPLRDDLLRKGLLKVSSEASEIFSRHNIIYFELKTALPLSLRLGELKNMALSFDVPRKDQYLVDPDIEKYRSLTRDEKKELGLYEN